MSIKLECYEVMLQCEEHGCSNKAHYVYTYEVGKIRKKYCTCFKCRFPSIQLHPEWKEFTIDEYEVKMVLES